MSEATLSEVLEGYAIATPEGNDQETLRRWMERHPQFADDLMDFAAARALARTTHYDRLADERPYAEIGMIILRKVLKGGESAPPESLTAAAEAKGWKKPEFAKKLGLSMSLLMYLEKRRLDYPSIPTRIVAKVADLLETSEQAIAAYLSQPPILSEASFKTKTRPEEERQRDFADAVREDQTLSASEKQYLLSE